VSAVHRVADGETHTHMQVQRKAWMYGGRIHV